MPKRSDPNVLVGTETGDDAAVYRLSPDLAIVETLDFFTPVVDDPFDFGRVAAANAFSDVYAMGGTPIFALNIMAFPIKTLGPDAFRRVLEGGQSIADEAGVSVLGGHSIDDPEPKYGMVVTGIVHPDKVLRNVGAKAGDVLFLTKPLGTGVLTSAIKRGDLSEPEQRGVIAVMTHLNRAGAEAMTAAGARAATDVTGFGLFGHLLGMVRGADVGVEVRASAVPFQPRVHELIGKGVCPGGTKKNLAYFGASCDFDATLTETERLALADAQTSGGLLVACPAERADELEGRLREAGTPAAARIGEFTSSGPGRVRVER